MTEPQQTRSHIPHRRHGPASPTSPPRGAAPGSPRRPFGRTGSLGFAALAGLGGLGAWMSSTPAEARLRIVATLPDLAAIAADIGQDQVTVTALALPTQDPHYVDARPSFLVPLSRADLLIVNGLDLEVGWLPRLVTSARNRSILPGALGHLDASVYVQRLQIPSGPIDRAMGDIHSGGNPHFLHDPRAGLRVAAAITDRLVALDPAHEDAYRARLASLDERLTDLAETSRQRFQALPAEKRRVVVYHESLAYFFDWLGLEQVAALEPKPGIAPNPGHVADVLARMRRIGARVILQEEFYPHRLASTIVQLTQGEVVRLRGGARFAEGESYAERIERNVEDLYHALVR